MYYLMIPIEQNEFEEHMDEGKVILIVNDSKANDIL